MANHRNYQTRPPVHIPYKETEHGFIFGDAEVKRVRANRTNGSVTIQVHTSRTKSYPLEIRISKTGNITVYRKGRWMPIAKDKRQSKWQ